MDEALPLADPERALALAYAPAGVRGGLNALFALDERLGAIVASATEVGIAAIKLAWWRDALVRLDGGGAPAEPLLQAVAREIVTRGVPGSGLADLATGWLSVLDGDPRDVGDRGALLFEIAAALLGGSDPRIGAAGRGWAMLDRARCETDPDARRSLLASARDALAGVGGGSWPLRLRPLGMLATLARRDAVRGAPGRPGSPGRVLRALLHRATGY